MHLLRLFRHQADSSTRRLQARRRPLVEALEGRQLLSSFTVTNVNDSGSGSLRQAIISSNAIGGATVNTISFKIGSGGLQTIALKSALPVITHPVVIDATTQPGTGTTPRVVLDGNKAGSSAVGLNLTAGKSVVKGLVVDEFAGGGVLLSGASGDSLTADYIGVNAADNAAAGNGAFGIRLTDGASGNSITQDVISGNDTAGVHLNDGSHNNVVAGDFIGTDASGAHALPNDGSGVIIDTGSYRNTIGGTTAATADVLSGNSYDGVHIEAGSSNVVAGDFIGTDVTGTKPLGNGHWGVEIEQASDGNLIGGSTAGMVANVISANTDDGVVIESNSQGNVIQGNLIGTDVTSTHALGNAESGVLITDGASDNVVGGTTPAARNIISSNQLNGVHIQSNSTGNVVEGNFIGTDVTGTRPLGNVRNGVLIDLDASKNIVGGTAVGAINVLSGNGLRGVELNSGAEHNLVEGNFIGTDVTGTKPLGNESVAQGTEASGIFILDGANDNIIGGSTAAAGNIISANGYDGVHITDNTTGTVVEGNFMGTDVTGTHALGNARDGVEIDGGSKDNVIGGTAAGDRNVISGNHADGVQIWDDATGNLVEGVFIGTDVTGSGTLANGSDGVKIESGSSNNTIGGSTAGAANLIANNLANGVELNGAGKGNLVEGDTIDDNGFSNKPGDGVYIAGSPGTSVIDCTIEFNRGWGILVTGSSNATLAHNTVLYNGLGNVSGG